MRNKFIYTCEMISSKLVYNCFARYLFKYLHIFLKSVKGLHPVYNIY